MDILGTDNSRIATSVEEAEAANRASGMKRAIDRMRGWFIREPDYVTGPQATVTDIREARSRHEPEVTDLEVKPVPVNAEGKVVDMAQHRRLKAAEAEVEAAYASTSETELASAEEALEQQ